MVEMLPLELISLSSMHMFVLHLIGSPLPCAFYKNVHSVLWTLWILPSTHARSSHWAVGKEWELQLRFRYHLLSLGVELLSVRMSSQVNQVNQVNQISLFPINPIHYLTSPRPSPLACSPLPKLGGTKAEWTRVSKCGEGKTLKFHCGRGCVEEILWWRWILTLPIHFAKSSPIRLVWKRCCEIMPGFLLSGWMENIAATFTTKMEFG